MATLTETAYWTRKIIHWGIVGIVALLVFRALFIGFTAWWVATHPPPPTPPNVAFQRIPTPNFPRSAPGSIELTYNLQTVDGNTPFLGDTGKVYFMPKPVSNFLSYENAKKLAGSLGFTGEPAALSKRQFLWTDPTISYRTLKVDIVSGNFVLKYDITSDLSVALEKNLPTKDQAISEIRGFLDKAGVSSNDILAGNNFKIAFLKLTGNQLTLTTSLSEADFVRVDVFRQDLDHMSILTPDPVHSLVYFIFSGSKDQAKRLVEVGYTYNPISIDNMGTYPLRATSDAYKELTDGNAYVAAIGDNNKKINILKIYMAYYESSEPQNYLQPVYVFEGEKGFFAYVPAIIKDWLITQ